MAVSKKRDKNVYKAPRNLGKAETENPKWLVPTAVTLLVFGPAWIVVYYITRANYPLPIGDWNLVVGFAFMAASMALFTRWK
ncbi:cell division protein CrgA [Demequina sp. NBRC 110057]|uniref:cell division protein CrgA n=1 Tax=Demequina sp. NBRC 110057 TaxID=1570346 RepID=UPI001F1AE864|nr:cell division protein CrgA [Demequina sp. NBRC 110057]